MTPLYIQVLKELEQEGVKWVQIDEPALVTASHEEAAAVKEIYQTITEEAQPLRNSRRKSIIMLLTEMTLLLRMSLKNGGMFIPKR